MIKEGGGWGGGGLEVISEHAKQMANLINLMDFSQSFAGIYTHTELINGSRDVANCPTMPQQKEHNHVSEHL